MVWPSFDEAPPRVRFFSNENLTPAMLSILILFKCDTSFPSRHLLRCSTMLAEKKKKLCLPCMFHFDTHISHC